MLPAAIPNRYVVRPSRDTVELGTSSSAVMLCSPEIPEVYADEYSTLFDVSAGPVQSLRNTYTVQLATVQAKMVCAFLQTDQFLGFSTSFSSHLISKSGSKKADCDRGGGGMLLDAVGSRSAKATVWSFWLSGLSSLLIDLREAFDELVELQVVSCISLVSVSYASVVDCDLSDESILC